MRSEFNNFTPNKKLGQHFLTDLNLIYKIVKSAGELSKSNVLEIGPGPGNLTKAILESSPKRLIAVDADARCTEALDPLKLIANGKLDIVINDALKIDEINLFGGTKNEKIKIISNLPYNISTELLFKWLNNISIFSELTLMFQKEVADRICARPNSKAYGKVSVITQLLCEVRKEFDIPPQAFTPPPKIYSTVLNITPRSKPLYDVNIDGLKILLNAAFGQRRKMLRSSLKQLTKNPKKLLEAAGIDPTLRPEQLEIEQLCALANGLELNTG